MRASQQEAQQKEWSACLQVKQAVAMAEEANLHKTRVRERCTHTFSSILTQTAFLTSIELIFRQFSCFLCLCVYAGGGAV